MNIPATLAIFGGAALAEIAGCFAFWSWMRQGTIASAEAFLYAASVVLLTRRLVRAA